MNKKDLSVQQISVAFIPGIVGFVVLAYFWVVWGNTGLHADATGTASPPISVYELLLAAFALVLLFTTPALHFWLMRRKGLKMPSLKQVVFIVFGIVAAAIFIPALAILAILAAYFYPVLSLLGVWPHDHKTQS